MVNITLADLKLPRSGRLFRIANRKTLTQAIVNKALSAAVEKAGKQVGKRFVQAPIAFGNKELGSFSFIAFRTETTPAFVLDNVDLSDVRHGFMSLFERNGFLLVSTSNLRFSEKLIANIGRLSRGEMQHSLRTAFLASASNYSTRPRKNMRAGLRRDATGPTSPTHRCALGGQSSQAKS